VKNRPTRLTVRTRNKFIIFDGDDLGQKIIAVQVCDYGFPNLDNLFVILHYACRLYASLPSWSLVISAFGRSHLHADDDK